MNGLQLATKVKKLNPESKIILMTAFGFIMSESEAFTKSTHVVSVIELPLSLDKMEELLKSLRTEAPIPVSHSAH